MCSITRVFAPAGRCRSHSLPRSLAQHLEPRRDLTDKRRPTPCVSELDPHGHDGILRIACSVIVEFKLNNAVIPSQQDS